MREVRVELGVGYLDEGALQNRATNSQAAIGPHREYPTELLNALGGQIVLGGEMKQLAVELDERAKESAAQRHRALDDRVEHRLHVRRRATDNAQDLGGRRLLLQGFGDLPMRLGQRAILFLQLREQADVLDRDDGLVSESLEEGGFGGREAPDFGPGHGDDTYGVLSTQHRHGHD